MDLGFLTATELGFMNKWQNFVISESSLTEVLFTDKIGLAIFTDLSVETKFINIHKLKVSNGCQRDQFFFPGKLSCEIIKIVDLFFLLYTDKAVKLNIIMSSVVKHFTRFILFFSWYNRKLEELILLTPFCRWETEACKGQLTVPSSPS